MSLVCLFQSTDQGAPVLSGTVGALIGVLDACLVDGYGIVAASSITRAGSIVTVTTSAPHGFAILGGVGGIGPIAQISGANETAYNGRWRVATIPSASTFTYDIGAATPATPATGTLSTRRAPAGWSKPFSGTNKAVYRQPPGFNRFYLRVDDNSPAGGSPQVAGVRAYETMTDVDTGSQPFPTIAQEANALAWAKSNASSTAARAWGVFADEGAVYFTAAVIGTAYHSGNAFGDLANPYKPGDAFHTLLIGGPMGAAGAAATDSNFNILSGTVSASQNRHYIARSYTQLASSTTFGKLGDMSQTGLGQGPITYPAPHDNGLYVSRIRAVEGGIPRGIMPGLYQPLHTEPLADGDVVGEITGLPGAWLFARLLYDNASAGQALFDLAGPWR